VLLPLSAMKVLDRPFVRLGQGIALTVAAVAFGVCPAAAETLDRAGKLDGALRVRAAQLTGRSRVIVEFKSAPDVRVFARGAVGRRVGDRLQVGEVDNTQLASVANDVRVARVVIDRPAFATMERTGAAIGAAGARQDFGLDGRGVGVAIVDSGITAYHDDLARGARGRRISDRVVHFKDFTRPASTTLWATDHASDEYGHGTHVAGIIAGNGYDSRGARTGIAPGANLIGLKVLDRDGNGYVSDVIAAIDYAISAKAAYNIRIINLSVASAVVESYRTDPLTLAARRATDAGIVVIAAAGNIGRNADDQTQFGGITSPGNAPWVLTVGAASHNGTARRNDDTIANFSSRGPTWIDFVAKPDVVAPGVGIESLSDPQSTLYEILPEYLLRGTVPTWYKPYISLTGTSMAAPVVTGTVALMLQANPKLTPNAVKAILQFTAQGNPAEDVLSQGAGVLNARGAVRLATYFAAPQRGLQRMYDRIEGDVIRWSRHIIWGNYQVTGGIPLPGSNAWKTGLQWGAMKTATGEPVVWGAQNDENIVWSTNSDENIVWSTNSDENIVWSTGGADENIVWSTGGDENIVWSTAARRNENIVWSTAIARNVVWGNDCEGRNCRNVIWGARSGGKVWGTSNGDENIVWSTAAAADENIVWSTAASGDENIVWSTAGKRDENIVWSTSADENIVWSTASTSGENIVWSADTQSQAGWSASVR
jgi:serine protease AprX